MLLTLLRAKLHRLTVTQADLNYIGSIALDPDLLEAVEEARRLLRDVSGIERISPGLSEADEPAVVVVAPCMT